jgi:5'(3')-deoxyribonucleotidase
MRRLRFLLDVDEVLANFVESAIKIVSEVLGRPWSLAEAPPGQWDMFAGLSQSDYEAVYTSMNEKGYCSALQPLPGSQDAVHRLQELCDVFAVTTPHHSRNWTFERTNWLYHKYNIPFDRIIYTEAKYVCLGDFLLDDSSPQVLRWKEHHPEGEAMLWTTENNSRVQGLEALRVGSWDEVIQRVSVRCK